MILNYIQKKRENKEKLFSLLIDPDKYNKESLIHTIKIAYTNYVDFIFVGGSLITKDLDETINIIKGECDIPVVLFPGNYLQISKLADAILFLSLISGRNPDFLIGNHVITAPLLNQSTLEVIPTGYILINSGGVTSVQYMSNTTPIPSDKLDIISATAQAGEMLGLKLIYLEAGSGAKLPVDSTIVETVRNNINGPIIVGGGLRNAKDLQAILKAGADMVVVGNAIENDKAILKGLIDVTKNYITE